MTTTAPYDFALAFQAWSHIPVDDLDYMTADELILLDHRQLQELVEITYATRFNRNQWRNKNGELEDFMGNQTGKLVVDFGCGFGIDSLWFIRRLAMVILADMHPKLLRVAQRTVCTSGWIPMKHVIVVPHAPFFILPEKVDLFWSMGVLHHTPYLPSIMERMCQCLKPGGECRITLYSDKRWQEMIGEEPPATDTWNHPRFPEFVRKCDSVGYYADWYNEAKLAEAVKEFADVTECRYICNNQFIGAVVKPKKHET